MPNKQTPFSRMVGKSETDEEQSTALVPTADASVATPDEVDLTTRRYSSDKPQFSPDEITVPKLRLAQQLTPEVVNGDASGGQWIIIGGEPADEAIVIPLAGSRARELYDNDREARVCSATVAFSEPVESMVGVGEPGGLCSKCQFAQWVQDLKTGRNKSPACGLIYSYHVWDVTHQAIARVDFKSTGTRAALTINSIIAMQGWGKFAIKLGSTQQKIGKYNIYVPTVAIAQAGEDDFATARMLSGA